MKSLIRTAKHIVHLVIVEKHLIKAERSDAPDK